LLAVPGGRGRPRLHLHRQRGDRVAAHAGLHRYVCLG
jgi:hypothetical protein